MAKSRLKIPILILLLLGGAAFAQAQGADSPERFQPPPPPPMEMGDDLEDDEIEELEGDMPMRPQMPVMGMPSLPSNNTPPPPPPPNAGFRGQPTSFTKIGDNANAIRFQVLEGEFFQKGKRRGRATDTHKPKASGFGSSEAK